MHSELSSELSEVVEEYRANGLNREFFIYYPHYNELKRKTEDKPEGIAIEFADLLIRVFDTWERYNIPLEKALRKKMEFNKNRPYRHGGKKA